MEMLKSNLVSLNVKSSESQWFPKGDIGTIVDWKITYRKADEDICSNVLIFFNFFECPIYIYMNTLHIYI